MNISDLDCPQYVCFDTEDFQRSIRDSSVLSVDSLDTKHSDVEDRSLIMEDQQSVTVDENAESSKDYQSDDTLQSNDVELSTMEEIRDASCHSTMSGDLSNGKENFPIKKTEMPPPKIKSSFQKKTVSKPFHFQTDNRIKGKPSDNNSEYKEEDFTSKLRQNIVLQPKKNQVTKVQPFHLTEGKKRKHTETEFKSLAEQALAFQKKTPERYHTTQKAFQPQEHWEPPHLTAKSPQLRALKRRRVVEALSKEEQEAKEYEEMKAYEFHARPVDPKIYNQPSTSKTQFGIKASKSHLRTGRSTSLYQKKQKPEAKYSFRARPVPTNILNGPTGIKEKPVIPLTEAKSPSFEIEKRIKKRKYKEIQDEQNDLQKKKQVPKQKSASAQIPTVPWTKRTTEVKPFSFDLKDKDRFLQKEKKIQEEIENEKKAHEFHAQLLPSPSLSALPAVAKKPPTKPVPFNFLLENRNTRQFSFCTEEETTFFKAQPATVLKKAPFVPEKLPKPEMDIQEFSLHTDRRASERQQLKQIKEAEEFEKQQLLLLQKAKEEEAEHLELIKHRREIVHKAQPIRQYKPVEIKPSSIPLTQPQSPEFETDKRLQTKP